MTRSSFPLLVLIALALLGAIFASGCTGTVMAPAAAGDIHKFGSADEIREYIRNSTAFAGTDEYATANGMVLRGDVVAPQAVGASAPVAESSAVAKSAAVPGAWAGSAGSADHSTTNVQVAGVDEPDFIKNDGKYIYVITGQTLAIVDAYPATSAAVVSRTAIEDSPREIFLDGDRLVLLATGTAEIEGANTGSSGSAGVSAKQIAMDYYRPYPVSRQVTHAVFYDVTDRAHPAVAKDFTIDGDYIDARLIGHTLYLVTREQVYPYSLDTITVPAVREGTKTAIAPDVYYFDNPERSYAFTTVSSFDTPAAKEMEAKTYLVGTGNLMYVSSGAMYITYQKYHNVYSPPRPVPMIAMEDGAVASGPSASGVSAPLLWEDFNRMSETEKQAALEKLKNAEQESIQKREIDQTTTVIHKIAIDNGAISYAARGEVPGILESQFSLDEYRGNLRAATTSNVYTRQGSYEYNSVFVLDAGMKTIGSLTHIAEQEKIYSARFIGDRLYLVTFKRVDPFFVIDLSNPQAPKILGKLKIPGYSDYLHPYDATHIIGVGKETGTNDWGGVSTKGIKLALFDVTDVEHPKQIDKVEIGDAGSDSAALTDHKAFLFSKEKNLLVIPARVVKNPVGMVDKYDGSRPTIWYGAYVFGLTPETGFDLKGTVQHGTDNNTYSWYGNSQAEVKRSLYIDNVLYTLSSKKILANSLAEVNTTIKTVDLAGPDDVLYPPVLIERGMVE